MIVSIKDAVKLVGLLLLAGCATFVTTLFLNYSLDLKAAKDTIVAAAGLAIYESQLGVSRATSAVSGGCLILTAVVMLLFYVRYYIAEHGKQLGILKALGHSDARIAAGFWVFGISVLIGCCVGYGLAFAFMPMFYGAQTAEALPGVIIRFHPMLGLSLTVLPGAAFAAIAVLYALRTVRKPVHELLRNTEKPLKGKRTDSEMPFLRALRKSTVASGKSLAFFIAFSAFCFAAMTQMSFAMRKLSGNTFAVMVLVIGLTLAYVTLLLSLTSVVNANAKTLAMLRAYGYSHAMCSRAVLGGYRPVSYVGFVIGTGYQYGILKVMLHAFFPDFLSQYSFDFAALGISAALFLASYEWILYLYSVRMKRLSLKSIMTE